MSRHDFTVCDLLDANEQAAVFEPGLRSFGGRAKLRGVAVTVKCHEDNSRVKELLATDGRGKVLVVDGGGSLRRALLGDLIAKSAVAHGWDGVIVDGCVRDSAVLATLDLAVFARATIPRKTDRRGEGQVDVSVRVFGVDVRPGAYVYGDADGVIVSDGELVAG